MKRLTIISVLFLTVAVLMSSCKKDENQTTDAKTLLTAHKWRLTAYTVNPGVDAEGDGVIVTDLFAHFFGSGDECMKNTSYEFKADNSMVIIDGCDEYPMEGTWALSSDKKTLTFMEEPQTIVSISENTFKTESKYTEEGVTYVLSSTYAKF